MPLMFVGNSILLSRMPEKNDTEGTTFPLIPRSGFLAHGLQYLDHHLYSLWLPMDFEVDLRNANWHCWVSAQITHVGYSVSTATCSDILFVF